MKEIKEIDEKTWNQFKAKLSNPEAFNFIRRLIDFAKKTLEPHTEVMMVWKDGVSFWASEREFLTFNITRQGLRIYIHPAAGLFWDPEITFKVEKFNFWKSSYRKTTGKYCGLTIWMTTDKHLEAVKTIITSIPQTQ